MDEVMQMVKSKDFAKPKKLKQNDELEKENDILKKVATLSSGTKAERFGFVRAGRYVL